MHLHSRQSKCVDFISMHSRQSKCVDFISTSLPGSIDGPRPAALATRCVAGYAWPPQQPHPPQRVAQGGQALQRSAGGGRSGWHAVPAQGGRPSGIDGVATPMRLVVCTVHPDSEAQACMMRPDLSSVMQLLRAYGRAAWACSLMCPMHRTSGLRCCQWRVMRLRSKTAARCRTCGS